MTMPGEHLQVYVCMYDSLCVYVYGGVYGICVRKLWNALCRNVSAYYAWMNKRMYVCINVLCVFSCFCN